jgi:hypothetical protein
MRIMNSCILVKNTCQNVPQILDTLRQYVTYCIETVLTNKDSQLHGSYINAKCC